MVRTSSPPKTHPPRTVAETLDVGYESILRGIRRGRIPSIRIPATGKAGILRIPDWWLQEMITRKGGAK